MAATFASMESALKLGKKKSEEYLTKLQNERGGMNQKRYDNLNRGVLGYWCADGLLLRMGIWENGNWEWKKILIVRVACCIDGIYKNTPDDFFVFFSH